MLFLHPITFPQNPQFALSVFVFVSQPSRARSSSLQLAKPTAQFIPHAPPTQVGDPLFALHGRPQAPQLLMSVLTSVSQPSRAVFSLALQSPKPESQVMPQAASAQSVQQCD